MNQPLADHFRQVCVWPGTVINGDVEGLTEFFLTEFKTRIQYLEEITTAPDFEDGSPVEGTGGRNDVFFAVHDEDVEHFAVPRFRIGIRWIEDVIGNGGGVLYPNRIREYMSWEAA